MPEKPTLRIVIAEDDFFISKDIQAMVEGIGHEVIGVTGNGLQACEMADELNPDLILMDIKMPKMTGIEASKVIQANNPTAIVILTANESADYLY